ISSPAAAATIKSLFTMEGGSFGSCRSAADPAAAPSRAPRANAPRRLDVPSARPETRLRPGSKSGFDEAYCGTTWTVQNLGPSAQGMGRAHVARARRHKNDMHEERTHETQSQTVFDRRGNRHRLLTGGRASAVARPDRRRHRQ